MKIYSQEESKEILVNLTDVFPKRKTEFTWKNGKTYNLQLPISIHIGSWSVGGYWIDGISWKIKDNQPIDIMVVKSDGVKGYVYEVKFDELDEYEISVLSQRLEIIIYDINNNYLKKYEHTRKNISRVETRG